MEVFLDRVDVDINSFFQYSSYDFGNGLISNIISIVNDEEINNFVRIKSYMFNNYFDNTLNNASVIINLNLVIKNYNLYKDLLLSMCNNDIILSDIDKSNSPPLACRAPNVKALRSTSSSTTADPWQCSSADHSPV